MTLPKRWRILRGKYYYRVPPHVRHLWDDKQTFKLGDTEREAWRTWFERTGGTADLERLTLSEALDVFLTEKVAVDLAASTYDAYKHHIKPLKRVFGHVHPGAIKPIHVYRYMDKRPRVAGNREAAVLSSCLNFCIRKGWIEANPIKGVIQRNKEPARTRSPSRAELEAFCKVNPHLRGYVTLKRITGLRQGQLLSINLTEHWDGKYLTPRTSKGGAATRYGGAGLKGCIQAVCKNRIPVGPLFVNRKGKTVSATGFKSAWRRAMAKFVAQGGERFNEHDIRRYVASEAETLEHAQRLLGHQSSKVTAQVYRTGPEDVEVLK